jgi:hypothetical protein
MRLIVMHHYQKNYGVLESDVVQIDERVVNRHLQIFSRPYFEYIGLAHAVACQSTLSLLPVQ